MYIKKAVTKTHTCTDIPHYVQEVHEKHIAQCLLCLSII